jgi:alpha-beta hydrolase superfamily lysophospholipase
MKGGVLDQMGRSVRARGFVSGRGEPPLRYSDHYSRFASPLMLVLGGRDRIANADVVQEDFFAQVGSADKQVEVFADLAHGEFEYAPRAYRQVYPRIIAWLAERAAGSTA